MTDIRIEYEIAFGDHSSPQGLRLNPLEFCGMSDAQIAEDISEVQRERIEIEVILDSESLADFIREVREMEQ